MGSKCTIIFLIITITSLVSSSLVQSLTDKETSRRILHQPLLLPNSPSPPPPTPYQEPDPSGQFEEPFTHEIPTGPTFDQSPNAPESVPQVPSPTFEQSQQPPNVPETVPSPIAEKRSNPLKKIAVAASSVVLTLGLVFGLAFYIYKQRGENHQEPHKPGLGEGPSRINEESRTVPRSSPLYVGPTEPCTATLSKDRNFSTGEEKYDRKGQNGKSPPILPPPARINSPPPPMSSSEEEEESRDSGICAPHEACVVRRESPSSCNNSSQVMNQVDWNHRVVRSLPHSKRTSPRSRGSTSSPDTKPVIASSIQKIMQPSPPSSPYVISSSAQFQPRNVQSYTPKRSTFASPPPLLDVERLCSITDDDQLMSKIPIPPPPPPPPPPPLAIPRKYDFLYKHKPVQVLRQGLRRKSKSPSPRLSPSLAKRSSVDGEVNTTKDSSYPLMNADSDNGSNPKLKPLHWVKVQESSDGKTVWDQLESSSFKLNEEAVDFLFGSKPASLVPKDAVKKPVIVCHQLENRVLDSKKSQNIAILLRALNVTKEEVSEALLEGNPHELGPELWETLAKMAPSKEEEIKLKNYSGEISRLGPAERFLKAILNIPFAFKRVDALLYVSNFDSEVDYLRKSFRTLEEASGELKNSRLFLKLLEAVLRTGNRMNNGTNRGDAKAFKLDTLLRLADIKGTDNKTTLLHFVVQEIIKSEATCYNPRSFRLPNEASLKFIEDDFNKQGLQVVSGLSRELSNVKKAAGMDSDVLSGYVSKLEAGLSKVREASQSEDRAGEDDKFSDSMGVVLRECADEISRVKAEERKALSVVREVTHYFHGGATKEEAHSFRIFKIVRDFLNVLDNVCKDVQTMQERATMGSGRSFRMPMSASSLPAVVLSRCGVRKDRSSDDSM